jgi:hypothetical protein
MVAAAHFYATEDDQHSLLDYLGEPEDVTLSSWPLVQSPPVPLSRSAAMARPQVTVLNHALGEPVTLREGDAAMRGGSVAAVFNRLNWERLRPESPDGLVDSNASPVLLWTPATHQHDELTSGSIGSQADSMRAVSADYERWVNRVMAWVRRRGTKVWGLETSRVRPDLAVKRPDVTTVFALPEALALLQDGATGR